jgi:hypothetical protein
MRFTHVVPLVALSAAFVIPDEQVLADLAVPKRQPSEKHHKGTETFLNKLPCPHNLFDGPRSWLNGLGKVKNALDGALESVDEAFDTQHEDFVPGFDAQAWLDGTSLEGEELEAFDKDDDHPHPPHHGPPHGKPPHHGPPHKKPHHPPHHHKTNKTIYELISESKYTQKLAALVANDTDLVEILNSTKANFTLFVSTYSFSPMYNTLKTLSSQLFSAQASSLLADILKGSHRSRIRKDTFWCSASI